MNKVKKLYSYLVNNKLEKEAKLLLNIIKYAAPIIEVFDSEGMPAKREKRVYESEAETQQDYINALKHYAVNLFQINLDFLSLDKKTLNKIQKIFGVEELDSLGGGLMSSHIISGKTGDMSIFKQEFPAIWNKIKEISKQQNIEPNNASVLFFHSGKFTDPFGTGEEDAFIDRDPYYFAHDMGHPIDRDLFSFIIKFLNKEILPYYKDESGISAQHDGDFYKGDILANFFNDIQSHSEPSDIINDISGLIFSNYLSTMISDDVVIDGINYELDEDMYEKLEEKMENFENILKEKTNELLKKYEGKVMLFLL